MTRYGTVISFDADEVHNIGSEKRMIYCCCLPVEGNGYQREHTGCHGDVGDEIVDSAVEATKRPVTEQ